MKPRHRHTPEQLRAIFRYDPKTGHLYWRAANTKGGRHHGADDRVELVGPKGYLKVYVDRVGYYAHRVAWAVHHGKWPDEIIDHRNRVKADNKIKNLRDTNHLTNTLNRGSPINPS